MVEPFVLCDTDGKELTRGQLDNLLGPADLPSGFPDGAQVEVVGPYLCLGYAGKHYWWSGSGWIPVGTQALVEEKKYHG